MTDIEPSRACPEHVEFDPDCTACAAWRSANENPVALTEDQAIKGPRERKNAILTPERFEENALALGTAVSQLTSRYAELAEYAYVRQVFGGSGRGSADGSERDVGSVLSSTASIRGPLTDACTHLHRAHSSLNTALFALDLVEKAVERAHPDSFDPTEQQLRLHEKPATRSQLAETKRAKARELRREADDLDKQAGSLERKIRENERRAAEAQARREGKPSLSKSQRRRARRSGNGFNAPPIEPKPASPVERRQDWRDRQAARGYLPIRPVEDDIADIDRLRTSGDLPQQDQKEREESGQ